MGRKSRKKFNRLPRRMSDDGVNLNKATDLEEEMVNLGFDIGYYTEDEKFELDNFIFQYSHCIWHGLGTLSGPIMEVFSMEAMKEAESITLWNGQKLKGIMGEKQEELLSQIEVIKILLAAEALVKGFENVVLYVRFLYSIIIECDEEAGESKIVDIKEQEILKHYLHSYWMLQKRGIFVHMAHDYKKYTHVWEVPKQGENATSNLMWD